MRFSHVIASALLVFSMLAAIAPANALNPQPLPPRHVS